MSAFSHSTDLAVFQLIRDPLRGVVAPRSSGAADRWYAGYEVGKSLLDLQFQILSLVHAAMYERSALIGDAADRNKTSQHGHWTSRVSRCTSKEKQGHQVEGWVVHQCRIILDSSYIKWLLRSIIEGWMKALAIVRQLYNLLSHSIHLSGPTWKIKMHVATTTPMSRKAAPGQTFHLTNPSLPTLSLRTQQAM